jgi:hypothetical protein
MIFNEIPIEVIMDEIMIRKPEEVARHEAMSTQSNPRRTGIQTKEEDE